jgi:hypothetical protein
MSMLSAITSIFSGWTLEPAIFLSVFGQALVDSNAININMIMEKLCVDELGYEPQVCTNLTEHPDIETEVQIAFNDFETGRIIIGTVPGVLWALEKHSCKSLSKTIAPNT